MEGVVTASLFLFCCKYRDRVATAVGAEREVVHLACTISSVFCLFVPIVVYFSSKSTFSWL